MHRPSLTSNLQAALKKALAVDGVHLIEGAPAKWLELPDGTVLELFQASKDAVSAVWAVDGIDRSATENLSI